MVNDMWKKGLVLGIIIIFVGASVVPSTGNIASESYSQPDTVYVDDDFNESTPGWGYDHFDSIQDGVDAVNESGTVYVYNGTYYEHVDITKEGLNLIGEDRNTTIIDGSGNSDVVDIAADWINMSGFTVQNSGNVWTDAGIEIQSNYNNISDNNVILNGNFGIWVYDSSGNIISYNNLSSNGNEGISFYYDSDDNNVLGNTICSNDGSGINLKDTSSNNIISGNIISSNSWTGINLLHSTTNNKISGNTISSHDDYGIRTRDSSSNNIIYHNNLINNTQNGYDVNTNTWYNETLKEGNYWSDFDEHSEGAWDNDSDGIVDSPYNIPGGSNQDLYPLMYPWYPTHPDTVYVDDDYNISTPGFGYDRFNRIQYGINEVEGSTVYVYSGTYYENIAIDKTINLTGEDRNTTIINGSRGTYSTVNISVHSVNLSGFTIENIWVNGDIGILIHSNNNIISENNFVGNGDEGITIWGNNNTVSENIFDNNGDGINVNDFFGGGTNNMIYGNIISNSTDDSICFYGGNNNNVSENILIDNGDCGIFVNDYSYQNTFYGNNISNNQDGIRLYYSSNNTISNNNISENEAQGLRLTQSSFNMICENRITQNIDDGIALNHASNNNTVINNYIAVNVDDGIQIYESNNNLILKNKIIENIETGIQITENSNNNQLYHNNIENNTLQANDLCNNYWDNGYPSGGNYWSDYTGDDLYSGSNQDIPGSDGIGDTPYNIPGGSNQDLYPCMEPNGWINSPPNIPDKPSGEIIVLAGVEHTYTTSTIDSDSDSIWFKWDWGDGTYTDWLGPYDSGEEASATASWSQGTYQIRVKAKDNRNPEFWANR